MSAILMAMTMFEIVLELAKRRFWPSMIDIWQELEQENLQLDNVRAGRKDSTRS